MALFGLYTKKDLKIAQLEKELERRKAISPTDPTLASIFNWRLPGEAQQIQKPEAQIPIIYACIKARTTNLAQVPIRIMSGEQEVEGGPLRLLLDNPNPRTAGFQLIEGIGVCLDARGNAFVLLDERELRGIPLYLYLVNPKLVDYAYDRVSGEHVGWWLKKRLGGEPEFVELRRIIHFKYYNVNDDEKGLSPLSVARLTYETEWDAMQYNRNFFQNDGTPPVVYTTAAPLSPDRLDQLRGDIIEARKGVKHSHEAMILHGGLDAKTIGIPQKDMEFLGQRKFNREEFMMIYKVPKAEVELYEDMNYATAQSADRAFWKKTIMPFSRLISAVFNRDFFSSYGVEIKFDFQAIDVLNDELLEKVEAADKLVRMGWTLNQVNDRLNLGFESVEWGDEPNVMPAASPFGLGQDPPAKKSLPGELPNALRVLDEGVLEKKWNRIYSPILPIIGRAASDVRKYFYSVKQKIYKTLASKNGRRWVMKDKWDDLSDADILAAFNDQALRQTMTKHMKDAIERGLLVEGSRLTVESPAALKVLSDRMRKLVEVNHTAPKHVLDALKDEIEKATAEGLGAEAAADAIFKRLDGEMKYLQAHARTIARTEVAGAFSVSRHEAVMDTEPEYIRWISSRDDKVRDSHRNLDGKFVKVGEKFVTIKGNEIRYPHDPEAAAGEVINCRCTFDPIYFKEDL